MAHFRKVKSLLYRWAIRTLHRIIMRLDDWCYAQEASCRLEAGNSKLEIDRSVDRTESAARERQLRHSAKAPLPRLRYAHGEWVQP